MSTATQTLQAIRDAATGSGYETTGDDHNQRIRFGCRIYDLDAGYSSQAVWIRLSFRRAGKPTKTELGKWEITDFDKPLGLVFSAVGKAMADHEHKIWGRAAPQDFDEEREDFR